MTFSRQGPGSKQGGSMATRVPRCLSPSILLQNGLLPGLRPNIRMQCEARTAYDYACSLLC